MNRKIVNMPDPREEEMLRRALADMAQEEICAATQDEALDAEYERTLPGVQAHIARRTESAPRRVRRSLRAVALIAAVLVTFSGVCLASEDVREGLFRFAEKQWGRYREVKMYYEGMPDAEYAAAVSPDDPRLEYVWADWPLHYYPLYLPEDYLFGEKLYTFQYAPSPVTTPGELTEEEQQYLEQLIEADLLSMDFYSSDPQQRNAITFAESGRKNFRYDFESETNEVFEKVIGSRTVQIVKAGSSYRCFWQQDDHILLLSTTGIPLDEVEKIIANVERIR